MNYEILWEFILYKPLNTSTIKESSYLIMVQKL